jgi:hypothetical protein
MDCGSSSAKWDVMFLHQRGAQPDEGILRMLESALRRKGYRVFVIGDHRRESNWAQEIEREVKASYAVVPLLSLASISSEVVAYGVRVASETAVLESGRPRLFPVRITYGDHGNQAAESG